MDKAEKVLASGIRLRHVLIVMICGGLTSFAIGKSLSTPFFWIGLVWTAIFLLGVVSSCPTWFRATCCNLMVFAFVFACFEAYCVSTQNYVPPIDSKGFVIRDNLLGWAPARGMVARSYELGPPSLLHKPRGVIFDVTYTIGSNGLRVAPACDVQRRLGTVLFFGCSYTFGEGLKDNETLPYDLGVESGGRYCTFNFAFNGYSPAQMLSSIESGAVKATVHDSPLCAYYVALPHHVWRVAGRVAWIQHEPRYVLDAQGIPQREGEYKAIENLAQRLRFGKRIQGWLEKCATWRWLGEREVNVVDEDIVLYLALVGRSRDLLKAQYPGIEFRAVLWPPQDAQQEYVYRRIQEGFSRMGIRFDRVLDLLPGYSNNRHAYILSPYDWHPSALANRLIAQRILKELD